MSQADIRLRGFLRFERFERAREILLKSIQYKVREVEEVELLKSVNRVLAEDIHADMDLPPFDRAAMDGYAVRAEDTFGASSTNPILLKVVGKVEAGIPPEKPIGRQEAMLIFTGAPIPKGANAVVMVEHTNKVSENEIEVLRAVAPYENVSLKGEDVKKGELILRHGTILKPHDIGMLSALGRSRVRVYRKASIGILSTGEEITNSVNELSYGKILDSNRPLLISLCNMLGFSPIDLGISPDNFDSLKAKIEEGLKRADIIAVTGGTAVGERDLMPRVLRSFENCEFLFHGVSIRPAAPTGVAKVNNKLVFCLPGNPVAAYLAFHLFVIPAVYKMSNAYAYEGFKTVKAKLSRPIPSKIGRRDFVRVSLRRVNDEIIADPIMAAGSSILSSLVKADGIAVIPEDLEGVSANEEIEVLLIRPDVILY